MYKKTRGRPKKPEGSKRLSKLERRRGDGMYRVAERSKEMQDAGTPEDVIMEFIRGEMIKVRKYDEEIEELRLRYPSRD